MKKIFLFLGLFVCFIVNGQEIYDKIDSLYTDYTDEYLNGDVPTAFVKQSTFLRVSAQYYNLLWSLGMGDTEQAGLFLSDINSILGTSFSLPSPDFAGITQSYYDLDSIRVGNMVSFIDYILDSANVASIAGSVKHDSLYSSMELDTLIFKDGAKTLYLYQDESDLGYFYFNDSGSLNSVRINVSQGNISADEIRLFLNLFSTPTSTSGNIIPNYSDDANTSYSWVSDDELGLVLGGQAGPSFGYAGSKNTTDLKDSLIVVALDASRAFLDSVYNNSAWLKYLMGWGVHPADSSVRIVAGDGTQSFKPLTELTGDIDLTGVNNGLILFALSDTASYEDSLVWDAADDSLYVGGNLTVNDSVYFTFLRPPTRYGSIYVDSVTYSLKTDSIILSSLGLVDELLSPSDILGDTDNGEIKWVYWKDGKKHEIRTFQTLRQSEINAVFQVALEHSLRYDAEAEKQIKNLKNLVLIFIFVFILLIFAITFLSYRK